MTAKRALVTGAGGFVGAALCRRLLHDGWAVGAVLRPGASRWRIEAMAADLPIHELDLRDELATKTLVARERPQCVFHLASHGAYPSQSDADAIIQTNIVGTWNLLKAAASIDYEIFVNAGSSSEYGFKQFAMRENDVLEPNSYYSVSKAAQTLLCQHVAHQEHRSVTTLRLFSVYGPFEEPSRLVPTVIRSCLESRPLSLVSPSVARDFVYLDDVVEAFLRIDQLARLSGEIVNIGTGVQCTVRDVVDLCQEHSGIEVSCRWGDMTPRIWDATTWVADCTKAARLLDWRPAISLSVGIRKTVEWTRARMSCGL